MKSALKCVAIVLGLSLGMSVSRAEAFDWKSLFSKAGVSRETSLADTPLGPGIKEVLKVATDRSVEALSRQGGFSENPLVQIKMPSQLA
ncbi:MAG: DUF4197 family protein, partial [Candidatus Omnitrophica bacterium]|nr:DUF4197 family protein [Candidatus Omnitrophota bacterium]